MFKHGLDVVECLIRNEILEWFTNLIRAAYGPDIHIRCLTNKAHFSTHTCVNITGEKTQMNHVIMFISQISEQVQYNMPWLSENTYYILYGPDWQKIIEEKLNSINDSDYNANYYTIMYSMTGISLTLFVFDPILDDTKKKLIEHIFKSSSAGSSIFITHPKDSTVPAQSTDHMETNILTALHGQYLPYLSLEDILSLEIANKGHDSWCNMSLDHDIRKFLRDHNPQMFGGPKIGYLNLRNFKIDKVLRYFIDQYHHRFKTIGISNILAAREIRSLSSSYNIEIECNQLIHIDFNGQNEFVTNDFCGLYHFDPTAKYFLNYNPQYAAENYLIHFNSDDSLDLLTCSKEFSYFVLKSSKNCSAQKTKSVLKCLTEHFNPIGYGSVMALYEVDLNHESIDCFGSLLRMMRDGCLIFNKMYFKYKTLIAILDECAGNELTFKKCRITQEYLDTIGNNSSKGKIRFYDMDIELDLLRILTNTEVLAFSNCRLLSANRKLMIYKQITGIVKFEYTALDVHVFLNLLHGLQNVPKIYFLSCTITHSNHIEMGYLKLQNNVWFANMVLKLQILFQIFKHCEFKNRIAFQNCHFYCGPTTKCSLKPVNIQFTQTKFDCVTLLTILESMHKNSKIFVRDSTILELVEHVDNICKATIRLNFIEFAQCRLKTQTLLKLLSKMTKHTKVVIHSCVLTTDRQLLSHIDFRKCEIEILFYDMLIESQIIRALLPTNSKVSFHNCHLNCMADDFSDVAFQSHIIFNNMTFDSAAQYKWLTHFTAQTNIEFQNCQIGGNNFEMPEIVLKPRTMTFSQITIDFDVLIIIMQRISEDTQVNLIECRIRSITNMISMRPIKTTAVCFRNMTFKMQTILSITKNLTNLSLLQFADCKILGANITEHSNLQIKSQIVLFTDMEVHVEIFQIFVQKCSKGMFIAFENCNIISAPSNLLSNVSVDIGRLGFINVNYSIGLLQMLQSLTGEFIVEYNDQLSNREITEICLNTEINGERFQLMTVICSKSIYFELFSEFFRPFVMNHELDTDVEYNLPINLIPYIRSFSSDCQFNWAAYTIKFVPANDMTIKIEFLKFGKVIDLFYELNDLPDDSDECIVDYF